MPKPHEGEKQADFVSRCIPIVLKEGTAKDKSQAAAVCYSMYRRRHQKKTNNMEHFTVNVQGNLVRDDILEGEEYWVAPLVMMTECVANGSQGPLYYSAKELERWTPAWNHKPIVTPFHPETGSACTQQFLNEHKIGIVLNAEWDGKQRAFGWFHKKRTQKIEPRVANALKTRKMMELSTGLYVDPVAGSGTFDGKEYQALATNHRPDHLAILPDKIGACSIAMGAGLLQLNELSHEALRCQLEDKIQELYTDKVKEMPSLYPPYVREVYDDYAIFYFGGNIYSVDYQVLADEVVSLVGDPTQVEQKVEYVPVENAGTKPELESNMAKKDVIDRLIKNEKTKFKEEDRKSLEVFNEEQLKAMEPAPIAAFQFTTQEELDTAVGKALDDSIAKNVDQVKEKVEKAIAAKKPVEKPVENADKVKLTPKEWLEAMPPEYKAVHNQMAQAYGEEVGRLVGVITANKANQFAKAELEKMELNMLRNLARLAQPAPDQSQQFALPNYFGGGAPVMPVNEEQLEVLAVPTYNSEKFAQTPAK